MVKNNVSGSSSLCEFLHDAMLAKYMLSSCVVRPSICHKPVLYRNDWTNQAAIWHRGLLPPVPHCVLCRFGYLQKLGYFLRIFVPNSGSFFHSKSIVLSTKLVDGRACRRHLRRSTRRGCLLYTLANCNPLNSIAPICCGFVVQLVPTVAQQLTTFRLTARRAVRLR